MPSDTAETERQKKNKKQRRKKKENKECNIMNHEPSGHTGIKDCSSLLSAPSLASAPFIVQFIHHHVPQPSDAPSDLGRSRPLSRDRRLEFECCMGCFPPSAILVPVYQPVGIAAHLLQATPGSVSLVTTTPHSPARRPNVHPSAAPRPAPRPRPRAPAARRHRPPSYHAQPLAPLRARRPPPPAASPAAKNLARNFSLLVVHGHRAARGRGRGRGGGAHGAGGPAAVWLGHRCRCAARRGCPYLTRAHGRPALFAKNKRERKKKSSKKKRGLDSWTDGGGEVVSCGGFGRSWRAGGRGRSQPGAQPGLWTRVRPLEQVKQKLKDAAALDLGLELARTLSAEAWTSTQE